MENTPPEGARGTPTGAGDCVPPILPSLRFGRPVAPPVGGYASPRFAAPPSLCQQESGVIVDHDNVL